MRFGCFEQGEPGKLKATHGTSKGIGRFQVQAPCRYFTLPFWFCIPGSRFGFVYLESHGFGVRWLVIHQKTGSRPHFQRVMETPVKRHQQETSQSRRLNETAKPRSSQMPAKFRSMACYGQNCLVLPTKSMGLNWIPSTPQIDSDHPSSLEMGQIKSLNTWCAPFGGITQN